MTTKQAVIDMIQRLPDDVTVVDIMYELYFRQKVDEGLRQLDAGEGIDHEEAFSKPSVFSEEPCQTTIQIHRRSSV